MEFEIRTTEREQFVEITSRVNDALSDSSITDGVAVVYCPHTTAGLTINENADPDVICDMLDVIGRLVPRDAGYRHCEGNADSHVKASMVGSSVTVPIRDGHLGLGKWQGVFFCEFDGPRKRHVHVQVLSA